MMQETQQLTITTAKVYVQTVLQLLEQAQRSVRLFSQILDHSVYNSPEIARQISRLATSGKHASIQILLCNPLALQNRDHRLLNLARKLDSHIQLFTPEAEHLHREDEFLLIDDTAYLYRSNTESWQGIADFNAPRHSRKLAKEFSLIWQKGKPPAVLQVLHV